MKTPDHADRSVATLLLTTGIVGALVWLIPWAEANGRSVHAWHVAKQLGASSPIYLSLVVFACAAMAGLLPLQRDVRAVIAIGLAIVTIVVALGAGGGIGGKLLAALPGTMWLTVLGSMAIPFGATLVAGGRSDAGRIALAVGGVLLIVTHLIDDHRGPLRASSRSQRSAQLLCRIDRRANAVDSDADRDALVANGDALQRELELARFRDGPQSVDVGGGQRKDRTRISRRRMPPPTVDPKHDLLWPRITGRLALGSTLRHA